MVTLNKLGLLITWLLLACSKTSSTAPGNTTGPVPAVKDSVQYGTPYAQVPDAPDAVIYQVNIHAFSSTHDFKGVQSRLDSIRALGVNVLYLMPVYPVGTVKSVNSPYCVKDYTGVNAEFGTLADLRTLVQEAHNRGMAVLFDWVANHTAWDNAWTANKSWYQQDAAGNIISPVNTGWNDVAALNYGNADMRSAMIKAMKYWVYNANIDGYRCDAADFVPAGFWKQAIDSLRAIRTHKLLLFAEGTRTDHFLSGFQLKYAMGFYYNLVNNIYAKNGSVQSIDSVNTVEYNLAGTDSRAVRYISNHDVDNSDGTPLDLLGGKQGSLAAFAAAAFTTSVPMIYNGQEKGCPVKLNFFNNSTVIDWTLNADMTAEYKRIIALHNSNEALRRGAYTSYSDQDVCAFTRVLNNQKVLVLVNLRNKAVSYTLPAALANSSWKNAFDGTAITIQSQVALQPYGYLVLQNP
ncbi:alpha-amylase family glycosyl hydrolase [Deminuibacter soli]|uniref:Alpha-amylase n=1 Tax=Deminuibacter soli TaxID=2291815 RepID=A0A3E1NGG9_9BACT|nr:alpha-amylase family glycosyl hydrolase [Deminuibacter soli]RFM27060.1 alpha-amylase [Deminuibacter soli]